jgi:uncharacterized protein with HEPN domain
VRLRIPGGWRLQKLAEAASTKLSDEFRDRHPAINWGSIAGFRNIAAVGAPGHREVSEADIDQAVDDGLAELDREGQRPSDT